jgi:Glycosyl transferase 4-like domain
MHKLVYLCDWLPPDFGAVGQYSLQMAQERAASGQDVVLVGLSSTGASLQESRIRSGRLRIVRLRSRLYDRSNFSRRMAWTAKTNCQLLAGALAYLREADEVLFTGSPPFLLHFLMPLNVLLRRRLVYRITDFHPECLMAMMERVPLPLRWFYRLTVAWRRRVDAFEVLGEDQRRRLEEIGIPNERIVLKRDHSPVAIAPALAPLPCPGELHGLSVLLYSGNFGVAHDHETFVEGYRQHHRHGSGTVGFWLNATGAKADLVEQATRAAGLPIARGRPVPLEQLPRLLISPDAHLITLRDPFVGYVLPSKVYGCIASGRAVLYVGSPRSDIHLLCSHQLAGDDYYRADVGDVDGVAQALDRIGQSVPCPALCG